MKFSVIIPFKNSESTLSKCIQSITSQTYNQEDYEIICVDNASTDSSKDIIDKFIKRYPKLIKVITSNANTVSGVRNDGAAVAKGEFLAFLDSDCVAPTWWLQHAVHVINKIKNVGALGGFGKYCRDDNFLMQIWNRNVKPKSSGYIDWLPACDFFIDKELFLRVGGFSEDIITSEDVDICMKVITNGKAIFYDVELDVIHLGEPKSLWEFFKKEFWRGKGVLPLCIKYRCKVGMKPILLACYSLIYVLGLLGCLFLKPYLFVFWLIVGFLPFLLLGIKKGNSFKEKIQLGFLYFVYGLARGLAIFVRS